MSSHDNGDFVVVWSSLGSTGNDTSERSVQARRFASDGTPLTGDLQVNTYTTSTQRRNSVASILVSTSPKSTSSTVSIGSIRSVSAIDWTDLQSR